VCINALYGNAASRMSDSFRVPGPMLRGYPDIDALYQQQALETDRKKREALLTRSSRRSMSACGSADLEYVWPSGSAAGGGAALMLINPIRGRAAGGRPLRGK